jgi:uncharacterized protein (TIRG00374 family)
MFLDNPHAITIEFIQSDNSVTITYKFRKNNVKSERKQMLIVASLTTLSLMLPLTPANLGIREGIISGCAYWFGLPADQALLAALIDRGAAVIMTFLLGLIFSRVLLSDANFAKAKS